MLAPKLLASKWIKITIVAILVFVVATVSSAVTYLFLHRNDKADDQESPAFSEMVTNLKQQAHDAIITPHYPERGESINGVGEGLKEILASKYGTLVTNDTFNSDEFLVDISVYPLQDDRIIRRITFVMKNNENDIPYEESRFFLQYIGDAIFFSNIEYLRFNERDFNVFENKDGVFAFSISAEPDYTTYTSAKELIDCFANIYFLEGNGFSDKSHVEIPLKIDSEGNIRLIQQNETIKGVVYDINNEQPEGVPECLFNSIALSFELPKGNIVSEPIDYDFPGLLLGLSDPEGNLRTLFIRKEDIKIRCDEYIGQIVFPRQNKLYSLKSYVLNEEMKEKTGDDTELIFGSLDVQKILCAPLGVDLTIDFEKIFSPIPESDFYDISDIPLYIGSDYVCYIQNRSHSGGGTYHGDTTDIRFDKLDNLSKFTSKYEYSYDILTPRFKEITLVDLLYGSKAKDLYQVDYHTYGGTLNLYIDFKQLSIKRNLGKWSLMLPVMDEYYHPGNGSHGNWVKDFAAYSNDVPIFLASNSESMEMDGVWSYWSVKDHMKFPGSNAFLAQYDYHIGIGNREDGDIFDESIDMKIPIRIDEYIVSINFADNNTQKAWVNELSEITH